MCANESFECEPFEHFQFDLFFYRSRITVQQAGCDFRMGALSLLRVLAYSALKGTEGDVCLTACL